MNNKKQRLKVLVLGGNGFIGSAILRSLSPMADVTIGTRKRKTGPNAVSVSLHQTTPQQWRALIKGYDVVINSVGILRPRKNESYQAVHTDAPTDIANACATLNTRLIHISAIGLSATARSRFIRSKYQGEQGILNSGAQATIVRPSLLDGEGGYGAKWFRRVAKWPLQFVMQSQGQVAPLQVDDLGEAVAAIALGSASNLPSIVELGGANQYSLPEYFLALRKTKTSARAWQLAMPKWMVRAVSHVFDVFAWTPLSFGHYELMQGFNVPQKNWLPTLLNRQPTEIGWQKQSEHLNQIKWLPECR